MVEHTALKLFSVHTTAATIREIASDLEPEDEPEAAITAEDIRIVAARAFAEAATSARREKRGRPLTEAAASEIVRLLEVALEVARAAQMGAGTRDPLELDEELDEAPDRHHRPAGGAR